MQTLNALQSASNYEAYGENRFWFLPDVALMTGAKLFSSNRTYSNKGGLPANAAVRYDNITYDGINPSSASCGSLCGHPGLRRHHPLARRA